MGGGCRRDRCAGRFGGLASPQAGRRKRGPAGADPVDARRGPWCRLRDRRTTPPINDISTDTDDPPVFWFTVTPSDYPAPNAEPQRAAYPDVRPLEMPVSTDEAFAAALALVEARGWDVLSADPAESQIEAIATSRLFGFADEVAIRVTETNTGARIDMRSRSRLGQIDRGANARRIEAFLPDLEPRAPN